MLVGSSIIESYMIKKPTYRANQATQWASEISSQILLKAYFTELNEPKNFDKEKDQTKKEKIIQSLILSNKSYKKIQV